MSDSDAHERLLVHNFARPKKGEPRGAALERAIQVLRSFRDIGLVLAPEVLEWTLGALSRGSKPLRLLQRRLCLTEIAPADLAEHAAEFGPLALAFDVAKIRQAGAMPVMYVPQGSDAPPSHIGVFCVNGAYHTKAVLEGLERLRRVSNPQEAERMFGHPVAANYRARLRNPDAAGNIVASYDVPASDVQNMLSFIGFNNIPFDHSIAVLEVLLNMFCPTDNDHQGQALGYYRQREWRLIGGNIRVNNRPVARTLSNDEKARVTAIDPEFWTCQLNVSGKIRSRRDLASVFEPAKDWNWLDAVDAVYAPPDAMEEVKQIVGDAVAVRTA